MGTHRVILPPVHLQVCEHSSSRTTSDFRDEEGMDRGWQGSRGSIQLCQALGRAGTSAPPEQLLPRGLLATPLHCTRNSNQGCASCSSLLPSTGQLEGVKLQINEQHSENTALVTTAVTQH